MPKLKLKKYMEDDKRNKSAVCRHCNFTKSEIEELKQSEKRYRELFNSGNRAVFIHKFNNNELNLCFSDVNDVACKMLEYTREELLKMTPHKTVVPEQADGITAVLNKIIERGSLTFQKMFLSKTGKIIPVEISSHVFNLNDEKVIMSIAQDITERQLLNEAKNYDKMKTEFFANISHELKTPINVILAANQLLNLYVKKGIIPDNDKKLFKHVNITKQNCYRLLKLVNNLIDFTKIDSDFYEVNLANYNIVNIVEQITLSVSEYVEDKGLQLIFDTDVEEKIMAIDPNKIERIMLNLLSNAIKFTEPGGTIFVDFYDRGENVIIKVKDTGIGIPREKQKLVFERFIQVDKSLARRHEGSGIGLSLVKSLVEMHGGRIMLTSEYGKGSEFIIDLPVLLMPEQEETQQIIEEQRNVERINIEFSDIYA